MDERTIERWMAIEFSRSRDGLVLAPRPLGDLLMESAPSAPTRSGAPHAFDPAVLARIAPLVSPLDRRRLRLPATFFVEHELPDDAYVSDEAAARLLAALGEARSGELRAGRLWLGHARARAISSRFPTIFQFVQL